MNIFPNMLVKLTYIFIPCLHVQIRPYSRKLEDSLMRQFHSFYSAFLKMLQQKARSNKEIFIATFNMVVLSGNLLLLTGKVWKPTSFDRKIWSCV